MVSVLVFGGSGLVGSAVCRLAVAKGWRVVSATRRGQPFATPSGHSPAWVHQVEWRQATPFDLASFAPLLASTDAVVSTLGVLLEQPYKMDGLVSPLAVLSSLARTAFGDKGNPLASPETNPSYERMNRDAALAIFRAFAATAPSDSLASPSLSPFVFLSAEDIFRPFIDERYITTKRAAEGILLSESTLPSPRPIRPVFIRPSMIYHPHLAPLSTVPATALSLTSHLSALLPRHLRPSLDPASAVASLAGLLTIPPIHVDTVASAIISSIEDGAVHGVVDVRRMRRMAGFDERVDREERGRPKDAVVL